MLAYRGLRGESVIAPPSRCLSCHRTLMPWEIIPVVSWVMLRGHCRTCHARIPIQYPMTELATGLLFTMSVLSVSEWSARIAWCLFWSVLMVAVCTDITAMKVPNWLTYPSVLLVAVGAVGAGVLSWGQSLTGILVSALVLVFLHWISGGRMGLGDAKLYASIGAMLGAGYSLESLVMASVSGSLVGLFMRGLGLLKRRQPIPFVPHIAVGVVLTVVFGHQVTHWYVHTLLGWQ